MIKRFVNGILSKLGYEVRKTQISFHASYLSQICKPKTVIDVGVGHGTFPLYDAFPNSHFILIEPLTDYEDSIKNIVKKYDCEVHYTAVGANVCEAEINVNLGDLQTSSLLERPSRPATGQRLERRIVKVTTLDTLYSQNALIERPILLKIDTEGNELFALKGATTLLQAVEMVILETSIAPRFENSYEFEDIILFMRQNGFYVYSFLSMSYHRGDLRQRFADVVFKRRS